MDGKNMRSTGLVPRKQYYEILWKNPMDRIQFFETLKPMIHDAWKSTQPRYSEQRYAEMFVKAVLNEFWRQAWKEMILNNQEIALYRNTCKVGIHRLPYRNNERVLSMDKYSYGYVPFFSRRRVSSNHLVYFQLKGKLFKNMLRKEIKQGHTYRFGKPTY